MNIKFARLKFGIIQYIVHQLQHRSGALINKFDVIAKLNHLQKPVKYSFDPMDYKYYQHTMTHQEGSALDEYDKFATYEFRL